MSSATPPNATPSNQSAAIADHPLIKAFRIGCLLRRLHIEAAEHCLGLRARSEVDHVFDRLRSMARQAVSEDLRNMVQGAIEGRRNAFCQTIGALWWLENRDERNQELHNARCDIKALVEEVCNDVLDPAEVLLSGLRDDLGAYFDPWGRISLQLGFTAALAQCNLNASSSLPGLFSGVLLPSNWSPFETANRECPPEPNDLAFHCRFYAARFRSLPSWLDELQGLWCELGFPADSFPQWEPVVDPIQTPDQLARFFEQLDSGFGAMVADYRRGDTVEPPPTPPGYLGLVAHNTTQCLTRVGWQASVEITALLKWEILRVLIRRRGNFTSKNTLREEAWVAAGLTDDATAGTVDNEISELRGLLRQLGIDIETAYRIGWRLAGGPDEAGVEDA